MAVCSLSNGVLVLVCLLSVQVIALPRYCSHIVDRMIKVIIIYTCMIYVVSFSGKYLLVYLQTDS